MVKYDPFSIAEKEGIDVRYKNFEGMPLGLSTFVNGRSFILLDSSLKEDNLRYFICAHELYHATEHKELTNYYISHKKAMYKLEGEANRFALDLIIKLYIDWYHGEEKSVYDIYDYFNIPEEVYNYV